MIRAVWRVTPNSRSHLLLGEPGQLQRLGTFSWTLKWEEDSWVGRVRRGKGLQDGRSVGARTMRQEILSCLHSRRRCLQLLAVEVGMGGEGHLGASCRNSCWARLRCSDLILKAAGSHRRFQAAEGCWQRGINAGEYHRGVMLLLHMRKWPRAHKGILKRRRV